MYGTKYILPFTNDLDELYEVYFDVLDYEGTSTQIIAAEDALTIRSTGGDENKMEPILGTEALVNIVVDRDTDLTIADLIAQHDNDIRVTIYRDQDYSKHVFQGFIVVEDNSQPFMDKPYSLSVRALDGLGLLKGVDLVDTEGLRFVGQQSILSWIAQILYKTGQTMNLRVYFNFFEGSFLQNIGALEQVYLNAITFSQGDAFNSNSDDPTVDVNASAADDAYSALEKIVRALRCRLFQEDGRWCLVSLYEYLNQDGFSYKEYSLGDPVNGIVPFSVVDSGINRDYLALIGKEEIMHPVQEDQIIYLKLANKWIKLSFTYDQSQNKVCNQEFAEGDRNVTYDEVIPSAVIDPTLLPATNLVTQGYDLYCWEHFNGTYETISGISHWSPLPEAAASKNAFIRTVLDPLGYEKDRFSVLQDDYGKMTYIKATSFYIDVSDILKISASFRHRVPSPLAVTRIFALLYGDDGSFWSLDTTGDGSVPTLLPKWIQTTSTFRNPLGGIPAISGNTSDPGYDGTQWLQVSANMSISSIVPAAKAPVSGTVVILLSGLADTGPSPVEYWYKDLSVQILPYLNGSYLQLKGDYNYSSSDSDIKQTISEDISISDSPKRYFKGALLRADSSLAQTTWRRAGKDESFRFTQLMERIMYNHLYRMLYKMEGTVRGLVYRPADDDTVIIPNGFLNSYAFADGDFPTKRFMLTSFEKDYATGQWRGVWVEVLADENAEFILPSTYKFSYLFQ